MNKTRFFTLILSAAALLSACAALPQTLPTNQPTRPLPPAATLPPIITPLPADGDVMPRFILDARQALAAKLNLPLDQIVVISMNQVDWPNACLGLPEKGEMCAEVITPGYRIMLRANNQVFEVHTGGGNRSVRIAPQAAGGLTTPVAEKARAGPGAAPARCARDDHRHRD